MDAKLKDMAEYIVIAIHEFAKRHQLEEEQAYRYLNHYKAIDFLESQYHRRSDRPLPTPRRGFSMILYHGTNINFSTIDLSASHKGKDFGKGFYLSDNDSQAYDFAVFKSIQLGGTPIVHSFKFDESMLSSGTLNYLCFQKYSREWANFVLANRRNTQKENIHAHDIVYGPIANDKVGVQIRNFMEGNIDFDTFLKKLAFMKGITFQYFFGTQRAIDLLEKI